MSLDPVHLKAIIQLEPEAAINYLESKGFKIGWDWRETLDSAHARAFTVAKAARLDILQDIRAALDVALKDGQTLKQFTRDLTPTLQAKGWWGKQVIVDSQGNAEMVQLGSPRRLATIYQTNLQSAYMAGRYQEMMAASADRPYWQYIAVLDGRTRASHRAMNGKVFRFDDPIWQTHFPPNGFNCRCRIRSLTEENLNTWGLKVESSAGRLFQIEKELGIDKQTGEALSTQVTGIKVVGADGKTFTFAPDSGFNSNPGMAALKPFTPPPLDGTPSAFPLPRTFLPGQSLPALPSATASVAGRLMAANLPEIEYAKAFLAEFDAGLELSQIFFDVLNEPLVISKDLFLDGSGRWKSAKSGRAPYTLLMADTLKAPSEIWLRWEESRSQPGKWLLKRRYIKAFQMEQADQNLYGLGVYEMGDDGWVGSTVFAPKPLASEAEKLNYINAQRDGFLLWQQK